MDIKIIPKEVKDIIGNRDTNNVIIKVRYRKQKVSKTPILFYNNG